MIRPQWIVLVGVALTVSACGSAGAGDARSAADRFLTTMGAGRAADACALLAPRAIDDLTGECDQALLELDIAPSPVDTVETWGADAIARTATGAVFLHEFNSGWLVTGAGCQPRADQPYECVVGGP